MSKKEARRLYWAIRGTDCGLVDHDIVPTGDGYAVQARLFDTGETVQFPSLLAWGNWAINDAPYLANL